MITLKQWMELVNFRITEGGDYYPGELKLHSLTAWKGDQDDPSFFICFDPKNQQVYSVEAHDYKRKRSYRLVNPEVDKGNFNDEEAYDFVKFTDLDVDEDFLEKAQAIAAGEEYDDRVMVQVEFSDEELLKYMKLAHERDMTFNAFIEEALRDFIERHKAEL